MWGTAEKRQQRSLNFSHSKNLLARIPSVRQPRFSPSDNLRSRRPSIGCRGTSGPKYLPSKECSGSALGAGHLAWSKSQKTFQALPGALVGHSEPGGQRHFRSSLFWAFQPRALGTPVNGWRHHSYKHLLRAFHELPPLVRP